MGIFKRKKDDSNRAGNEPTSRDYSHIDSPNKANDAMERGELTQILLLPEVLGGERTAVNAVPVPLGIDTIKATLDATIVRYFQDGLIDRLKANPEYEGSSMVPKRISFACTHSDPAKTGSFNPTLEIW